MKKTLAAALPLAALTLTACAGPAADPDTLSVQAEIYGLAYLAEQVGGSRAAVEQIIPPGTEVHGYEVSPAQVDRIGNADLVVAISTLAPAVDEAVAASGASTVIDVAEVLPTRPAVAHEDDEDGAEHAEDEGDEGDEHDAAGFDAHMWLAIAEMPTLIDAIAAELARLDPDGAASYTANAQDLSTRFVSLDTDYREGLASCERSTIIVTHPAYGYLLEPYGIEQVGVSGFDEETEPSPARLAEIGAVAESTGATTVFFGSDSSPKVAEVLAGELGLQVGVLSPISTAPQGEDYLSIAEANLSTLRAALGCS